MKAKRVVVLRIWFVCLLGIVSTQNAKASCVGSFGTLDKVAWNMFEIEQARVLNSGKVRDPDPNPKNFQFYKDDLMCGRGSSRGRCLPGGNYADFVISGTFHDLRTQVMGPTMRRGILDKIITPRSVTYGRGGMAILEDGTITLCRPGETGGPLSVYALNRACSAPENSVYEFLGGGALLVYHGRKVCVGGERSIDCDSSADLIKVQKFHSQNQNLNELQMRATQHTIIATQGSRAFVIWPKGPKTGRQIQDELCAAGFENVVKYDGGSGFFLQADTWGNGSGMNPTGLLISTK